MYGCTGYTHARETPTSGKDCNDMNIYAAKENSYWLSLDCWE